MSRSGNNRYVNGTNKNDPVVAQGIAQNGVPIVGALYTFNTGSVQWLQ